MPVKRTTSSGKTKHRKNADHNPEAAGKPREPKEPNKLRKANGQAGTGGKPKDSGKPLDSGQAKQADRYAAAGGKTQVPGKSKAAGKLKTADSATAAAARPSLTAVVADALADMKALEVKVLDVRGLTDIADFMVIASGTSDRHVRSVAQRVVERTKAAGFRAHGVEGQQDGDWVLIDLHEMIVHVMLPRVREFYGLEKLWDMTVTKRAARA